MHKLYRFFVALLALGCISALYYLQRDGSSLEENLAETANSTSTLLKAGETFETDQPVIGSTTSRPAEAERTPDFAIESPLAHLPQPEVMFNGQLASTDGKGEVRIIAKGDNPWAIRIEYPEYSYPTKVKPVAMVADRFIVFKADGTSDDELRSVVTAFGGTLVERSTNADAEMRVVQLGESEGNNRLALVISELKKLAGVVAYAEPDYLVWSSRTPNDPEFRNQRYLEDFSASSGRFDSDISAEEGWEYRATAPHQIIAVIDTGVDFQQPDLAPNLWTNPQETKNGIDDDGDGYVDDIQGVNLLDTTAAPTDDSGHGTAVAALIGARGNNGIAISGVVWETQLLPIKLLNADGLGSSSDATLAIDYATGKGATIINASWGSNGKSKAVEDAIARANKAGILFVTAAGNESRNLDSYPVYPASYDQPNILVVGAVERSGTMASFSNYGSGTVDIVAPGVNVISLVAGSSNATSEFSGTSFSTPLVSGIAALVREEFGLETPADLKARILSAARIRRYNPLAEIASQGYADLYRAMKGETAIPANDNFVDAAALSEKNDRIVGSTINATQQESEPVPDSSKQWATVWYSFSPDTSRPFSIAITGVGTGSEARAFEGSSLQALKPAGTLSPETNVKRFNFSNMAGKKIYIQIATQSPNWFDVSLELPPENDNFLNFTEIKTDPFAVVANTRFATIEEGESYQSPSGLSTNRSVWWTFNSPETGSLQLSTVGSDFDTILEVYTGDSLASLQRVDENDDVSANATYSNLFIDVEEGHAYRIRVSSKYGSGGRARLSGGILRAPTFVFQPVDTTAMPGFRASFRGLAIGPDPLEYQWYFDDEPIPGANASNLVIDTVAEENFGEYVLEVSSPAGSVRSDPVHLSRYNESPRFALNPSSRDYLEGLTLVLHARAHGAAPIDYQWFKDGNPIDGATTPDFCIANSTASDSGTYSVVATNAAGSATSESARIVVGDANALLKRPVFDVDYFDLSSLVNGPDGPLWIAKAALQTWTSPDGYSWKNIDVLVDGHPPTEGISSAVYGNGLFVVEAGYGPLAVGPSLGSLTTRNVFPVQYFYNGYFYSSGSGDLLRSKDCVNWETVGQLPGIQGKGSTMSPDGSQLGVISGDFFYYTSDGEEWVTSAVPNEISSFSSLTHDGQRFIGMSPNGELFTLTDGKGWESLMSIPSSNIDTFYDITYGNGHYVAVSQEAIFFSTDLSTWEKALNDPYTYFDRVESYGDVIVADGPSSSPTVLLGGSEPETPSPLITPVSFKNLYWASVGDTLNFEIAAEGIGSAIANISYFVDDVLAQSETSAGETFRWSADRIGNYTIRAQATDANGKTASLGATIRVDAAAPLLLQDGTGPKDVVSMASFLGSTYVIDVFGNLYRTINGSTWTSVRKFDSGHALNLFTIGSSMYVRTEYRLERSDNGIDWETSIPDANDRLIYTSGDWLVSPSKKRVELLFSSDGRRWIPSDNDASYGQFVGFALGAAIATSGTSSDEIAIIFPGQGPQFVELPEVGNITAIAEDENAAYVVLSNGPSYYEHTESLYRTQDFTHWEKIDLDSAFEENGSRSISSFAVSHGLFCLNTGSRAFVSQDLTNWTLLGGGTVDSITKRDGTYFLLLGSRVLSSSDGINWDEQAIFNAAHILATESGVFAWTDSSWSSFGLWYSPDGKGWAEISGQDKPTEIYTDLAYGNGIYVAVGDKQAVSNDGVIWDSSATDARLGDTIAFGDGKFVASAKGFSSLTMATSVDGANWTVHTISGIAPSPINIGYLPSAKLFVMEVEYSDNLLTSPDGETWTLQSYPDGSGLRVVGNFAYMNDGLGHGLVSSDGINWSKSANYADFYSDGRYFRELSYSDDGTNWTSIPNPIGVKMYPVFATESGVAYYYSKVFSRYSYLKYSADQRWEDMVTLDSPFNIKSVNNRAFRLGDSIRMISDFDLQVVRIDLVDQKESYAVGDSIRVEAKIKNNSSATISLKGAVAQARLVSKDEWTDFAGSRLRDCQLQDATIQPGQELLTTMDLQIPNGVLPGNYGVILFVDPASTTDDHALSNNYGWSGAGGVTIPSTHLSITTVGGGHVQVRPDRYDFAKGDTITVIPVSDPKHRLKQVVGLSEQQQTVMSVSMDRDRSIRFEFEENRYTLKTTSLGEGTIEVSPITDSYLEGDEITLSAHPSSNVGFRFWNGDIYANAEQVVIPIRNDLEIVGVFGISFQGWVGKNFEEEQTQDPKIVSNDADPDGDGVSNFWEYIYGTNPNDAADNARLEILHLADGSFQVTFQMDPNVSDYSSSYQTASPELDWTEHTIPVGINENTDSPITKSITIPESSAPFLFRLKAVPVQQTE